MYETPRLVLVERLLDLDVPGWREAAHRHVTIGQFRDGAPRALLPDFPVVRLVLDHSLEGLVVLGKLLLCSVLRNPQLADVELVREIADAPDVVVVRVCDD